MTAETQPFVIEQFLDEEFCGQLVDAVTSGPQEPAPVLRGTASVVEPRMRRAMRARTVPAPMLAHLVERFGSVMPSLERQFGVTLTRCQPPTVLIYGKGDHFKVHRDNDAGTGSPEHVRRRKVSVVVFLNTHSSRPDDVGYCGGNLNLYRLSSTPTWDNCRTVIHGRQGLLVAFPSHIYHDVFPVTHGTRRTVVSWYE